MNLAQLIKQMKPSQRQKMQQLLERKQISEIALDPHKMRIGAVIQDPSGCVSFTKTSKGWQTNNQITSEQIVTRIVKPAVAHVVKEDLSKLRSGESYTLLPSSLLSEGIGNEGNKLTFKRTDHGFVDPTYLSDAQMKSIVDSFPKTRGR